VSSSSNSDRSPRTGARAGAEAGLDALLSDAAITGGAPFVSPRALAAVAGRIARRPRRLASRAGGLAGELTRVAIGHSEQKPEKSDRRFTDQAWEANWLLRRVLQAYLAVGQTVDDVIDDAELDWHTERRARFTTSNVLNALAPSNFPWSNPTVLHAIIDEGGANLVRGGRRFASDVSWPPRLPSSVDTSSFEIGENVACTPGSVVLRTDVFELMQYTPQTDEVREIPLLFVPPTVNKFYVLDLAPGRSIVEHIVAAGQQVFMISWRNPDEAHGHFDLDTYAAAMLEARDAVSEITGQAAVNVNAVCSGGVIGAAALGHLAAENALDAVASLTLWVCPLDTERGGTTAAFASRETAALAIAESARRGYLDGRALAGVFAWMRPNEVVWNYVVNNYLLGRDPSAFDVLFWNQDTVRIAAGLHRDLVRLSLDNTLTRPGALTVLGSPVDLSAVDVDTYHVAALNDHIVPWENAYRGAHLLGGSKRFVLSRSGHIQAMVNPPHAESRSSYRVTDQLPTEADQFLEQTPLVPGSWWGDYVAWLQERSGELRAAPAKLGSRKHNASARAPGNYVHAT
jgi:polyhydroxyalkanoate synthase subunit PhaC